MSTDTVDTLADVQPLSDEEVTDALTAPDIPTAADPAPYGRKADGTPKRRPGRPRKDDAPAPAAAPAASAAPPKTRRRTTTPKTTAGQASYTMAVNNLLSIPVGVLVAVGTARDSTPLIADAATIDLHRPALAAAVGELAEQTPGLAAVLERLTAASPYAALATAVLAVGAQLAVNLGMLQPGFLGAQSPIEVTSKWVAAQQAAAAEAA